MLPGVRFYPQAIRQCGFTAACAQEDIEPTDYHPTCEAAMGCHVHNNRHFASQVSGAHDVAPNVHRCTQPGRPVDAKVNGQAEWPVRPWQHRRRVSEKHADRQPSGRNCTSRRPLPQHEQQAHTLSMHSTLGAHSAPDRLEA